MDVTVRNVDKAAYRALKARAAEEGKTVGELLSEAIHVFIGPRAGRARRGLAHLPAADFGPGTEGLSEEVDDILYGKRT